MLKTVIGVDLCRTAIKIGKFDQEGNCLESLSLPTPQPATPKEVAHTIHQGICQVHLDNNCQAIGVGTPGPADAQGRIAKIAIN